MNKDKTVSSDLIGRLRNTTLKKSQGLMPLYEAIVNSIHSLDETPPSEAPPSIQIHIKRHETTGELDLMKSKRGPEKKQILMILPSLTMELDLLMRIGNLFAHLILG